MIRAIRLLTKCVAFGVIAGAVAGYICACLNP